MGRLVAAIQACGRPYADSLRLLSSTHTYHVTGESRHRHTHEHPYTLKERQTHVWSPIALTAVTRYHLSHYLTAEATDRKGGEMGLK